MTTRFPRTQTVTLDTQLAPSSLPTTDTDTVAEVVLTRALDFCGQMMGYDNRGETTARLRQGYTDAHARLHYGIAKQVGEYLGAIEEDTRAVYLYDPDAGIEDGFDDEGQSPLVHLVIWTRRKTAALTSLLAALDRALVQRYADLIRMPGLAQVLDAQVVDDTEVKNHTGYGALLSSFRNQPLKVWER